MTHDFREYSLIAFTVLAQLAVGAFWILMTTDLCLISRFDITHTAGISIAPLLMILVAIHVSMLAALTHLGSPWIAYKALANLRTSWLSREILTANFFVAAAIAFTALQWLDLGSTGWRAAVAWLAVLAGASLLYSMARVYMLRTVPIWNTVYTPLSFFLTGLILGPLALGLLFTFVSPSWLPSEAIADAKVLPMVTVTALGFLVVELLLVSARMAGLLSGSLEEKQAIGRLFGRHQKVFFARLVASLLGAAGLIAMLVQSHYDPFCYFFGFAIILTAELLDRYIFYAGREVSRL
jgi:anaerobic dimethyl sulfoxide reductase subunit C (anchor subunit)